MPTDDAYEQTRRRFDEMEVEQQAQFLIEASAAALARSIEQAGKVLADGLHDVAHRGSQSSCASQDAGPGAAEPETAQQQASKGESSPDA